MPKIPRSPIRMYFLLQPPGSDGNNTPQSECKACGLRMKGNHASNMERHVRRSHPEIYEKYLEVKKTCSKSVSGSDFVTTPAFQQLDVNFDPASFIQLKKIKQIPFGKHPNKQQESSVTASLIKQQTKLKENIFNACIELVTTNGRPFSLINDSGFKALLDSCLSQTSTIDVSESVIKQLVAERAAELRLSILEKVRGNVINVKVDIGTVCNQTFVGISVYFYYQGKISSYMIAFVEINVRYETSELESIIWRELYRFEITREQIYCIVIDSGSNLNMMANETTSLKVDTVFEINTDLENIPCVDMDESITSYSKIQETVTMSEDVDSNVRVIAVFNETEEEDNDPDWCTTEIVCGKLNFETLEGINTCPITVMKCVTDVLQICINNVLKSCEEICDILKEARSLYQKLIILNEKKIININFTLSGSSVRWKTTFGILEKIVSVKTGCVKLGLVNADDPFWNRVENLLSVLKPCKATSDLLQKQEFVIGDVYRIWFNCVLETSKIDSPYATILTNCMREKQTELLLNGTVLAALFLDPRFNNMILNDEQKKTAVEYLLACHQKITTEEEAISQQMETNEEIDELERIFQLQENSNKENDVKKTKLSKLEVILRNFCESEPRLKTKENVVQFWEKKQAQYPDLYNLARVIFSVPVTQKSFFKLISQIHYTTSADIAHMGENLFNDVILLRSNFDWHE